MRRQAAILLAWLLLLGGCVTMAKPDLTDFSSLRGYEAAGVNLRLPKYFKRFEENGAFLFRPEPPVRPSPGVLVKPEKTKDNMAALEAAYNKVTEKMGGMPVVIRRSIAGRETPGLQDQLITHFIWIYALKGANGQVRILQIIAPVQWTDEQVLAFHDLVVQNLTLADDAAR